MRNPMRDAILGYAESRLSFYDPFDGSQWDEFWQSLIQSLEYHEQYLAVPEATSPMTTSLF
jgi:hypothetical protein